MACGVGWPQLVNAAGLLSKEVSIEPLLIFCSMTSLIEYLVAKTIQV